MDKKPTKLKKDETKELYEAIVAIDNVEDCKYFLADLLTKQELVSLAGRVHSAQLFIDGKTYLEVNELTKVSSATLARVSKCVKNGKGYNRILRKIKS
jgi:TrpR-related protein YerC/YecD